jgi:hypothetical protein
MEIAERPRRKYRKRSTPRDESAQPSAFPANEAPEISSGINEDAAKKKEVLEAINKIPEIFTPADVKWCFDVYVGILCFVYSIVLKCDFKALQKELEFTDEQKDMMAVPLAKIASKTVPASWASLKNEFQLIGMLGIYTVTSFKRAQNVAKEEAEKKATAERTQPVAPMQRQRADVHVPA